MLLTFVNLNPSVLFAEGSLNADGHHDHGTSYANFIPHAILNPDDSIYQAPEIVQDYVGLYTAQAAIDEMGVDLKLILNIQEDGLFNLAYYYENEPESTGLRFYATEANSIESVAAVYQDLTFLTGALRDGDGGLGSGLIRETIAPIVLLDGQGQADELYTYMSMAYGLRENYANARIYQNVGLYIAEDNVVMDVNHLIGLESEEELAVAFERVEHHEDQFLVEATIFDLLQNNFDENLIEHNDFRMDYQSANEFVQKVLAMHLQTNTSFPQETQVDLLASATVDLTSVAEAGKAIYSLLINETILYAFDGEKLYMSTEFEEIDGSYTAEKWLTN